MPKNWQEAHEWIEQGPGTELVVSCPRCERRGLVSRDRDGDYVIDWRDEARGWTWRDYGVTVQELASPEFGCGYDRRADHGFVGGAPLLTAAGGARAPGPARPR